MVSSNTPKSLSDARGKTALLRITHITHYRYDPEASLGYNLLWLTPRQKDGQTCLEHKLKIEPKPKFIQAGEDIWGNRMHYFEVHQPYASLKITSKSLILPAAIPKMEQINQPW